MKDKDKNLMEKARDWYMSKRNTKKPSKSVLLKDSKFSKFGSVLSGKKKK
jgi:hypothetical protein